MVSYPAVFEILASSVLRSRFDLSSSRDVIGHMTIPFDNPLAISYSWSFGTVFDIFNGECDAMVDMTLNDL